MARQQLNLLGEAEPAEEFEAGPASLRGGLSSFVLEETLLDDDRFGGRIHFPRHQGQLSIAGWQEEAFPVLISPVFGM